MWFIGPMTHGADLRSSAFESRDLVGGQCATPRSDECATFAMPQDLVPDEHDADRRDHAECSSGRNVGGNRERRDQQDRGDRSPASESAADAQP